MATIAPAIPSKDVEKSAGVLEDTQSREGQFTQTQRILIVAAAQFLGLLDQTAVNTAVPTIARNLNAGASISWIASSFLASSTATQLIVGRLSDIFGRKTTIIGALCMVVLGELLNGFAQNPIWLYSCRAVAGFGAGSLGSQANIIISDITTLKQRGKYFGIVGVAVVLGNGLGPVIGGLLAEKNWRWVFWLIPPLCAVSITILAFILPGSGRKENAMARLKLVDWFGVFMTLAGTFLLLVPITQVGSTFKIDSARFIGLLTAGVTVFVVLFIVEWKFIKLPVIALYLFGQGYGINVFIWQNVAIGWIYFGNLYYTPQYLQNVRGYSPSHAGTLLLPLAVTAGVSSAISGNIVSKSGRYLWAIVMGNIFWTTGLAFQAGFYNRDTKFYAISLVGICQGIGVGFTLQNNMVGVLAHTYKRDRGVAVGLRQFTRSLAGAIGIAASNSILSGTLRSELRDVVPGEMIGSLTASTADLGSMGLNAAQQQAVRDAYMKGIHRIYIVYAPLAAAMLLAMLPIRDRGLKQMDEHEQKEDSRELAAVEPELVEQKVLSEYTGNVKADAF
ncbi:putative transporter [Lachnellula suecica]|uniref:Putative transporter n=1 Tax=Lachnellula suecica TaxID=602035 RepID=A0A8T9CB98_9HELO|nr:putative transporter [Lachnellula suecica]